jgi:hypothetical protein
MSKIKDPLDFTDVFTPEENNSSERLETLKQIVSENFSKKDLSVKSDINVAQIRAFAVGRLFGNYYKSALVLGLVEGFLELSISKDRKSRKEFTEIAKSLIASPEIPNERRSLASTFLGDRR